MKFLHTMIRVKNLEESLRFYTELLEMEMVRTKRLDDCNLYFLSDKSGYTQIELTHNDETPSEGYTNGSAFGHFAFEVDSMDKFNEKLAEMNYEYLYEPFMLDSGTKIAFVTDPDCNEVELIESKND